MSLASLIRSWVMKTSCQRSEGRLYVDHRIRVGSSWASIFREGIRFCQRWSKWGPSSLAGLAIDDGWLISRLHLWIVAWHANMTGNLKCNHFFGGDWGTDDENVKWLYEEVGEMEVKDELQEWKGVTNDEVNCRAEWCWTVDDTFEALKDSL